MPSLSHPLHSLRLALALAVVCGLSFTGYRVSASETNGSWLLRLKNAPAAVWAAVFQANPETVRQSGVATDGNRARPAAQRFTALAPALPSALRSREALDDPKQPGLSDALLPTAFAPLAPTMTGCATPSFGAVTNFAVGDRVNPYSVAIGDLNGDGKLDMAVANFYPFVNIPGNVSVLLGTGTGSFGAPTNFGVGGRPLAIAIGDLNGDGKLDVVTANVSSNNVSVLLGTGTGNFGPATNFAVGGSPYFVAIGDLNRDGKPDLAVANYITSDVSVLLGTGAGSFDAVSNFAVGDGPQSIAIGDLNGDGKPDLVTANINAANVSVLLGTGTGSFGPATSFDVEAAPYAIAIGDLNGDGKPDLATANGIYDNVSVLLGTGTGSFGAATTFDVEASPYAIAIGDLNGDGKPDLAVANRFNNNVSLLLGTGTGSFGTVTNFGVGTQPSFVAIGELNGDGKLDLAVANYDGSNVSVLLNTCNASPCGGTSFDAATNFAVATGPGFVAIGDLNSDGKPDLATVNYKSNNVSVLLGAGTGSFGAATTFTVGTWPSSVAIGDLNNDGKPDLAVTDSFTNNVWVLLGTGTGSFSAPTNFRVGRQPSSVAIGDLNGDGKPDLAVANNDSNNVSVLPGTGTGSFGAGSDFLFVGSFPVYIALGDLNGDGKPDLVTANRHSHNVSVRLGTGTGNFGALTNYYAGALPASIAIGDLNGDGKPDLAVRNDGSDSVSVLRGTGTGSFGAAIDFDTGIGGGSVAIGDFNGDGKPDLAVANYNSNNVSVLLNNCLPNIAPTLTTVAITRQQGSPASNSQIATAADAEDAANKLQIQISSDGGTFGNTATSGGVTVTLTDSNAGATGTNPDALGKVFADIVAVCAASNASFTLKVTDSGALMATATLTVTVNTNAAPTVGNYANTTVAVGSAVTITPDAGPLDNGTIASVTATAAPNTFTGTFSGNIATGAVTVTNASPSGTYTITVTVTDNCGATVSRQFTLTVATPVVGGSVADPLKCTGTGLVVNVTATVSNTSGVAQAATLSAALPAQLLALPGTCQASIGTCAINNPASVTWSGSLTNGQTATITYQAQIADGVPAGTQVCVTSTASFTGGGSASVTACQTLNCPSSGPGALYPTSSALSSQKAGSVLIFNLYTSDAAAPNQQNTRIALTNIDPLRTAFVHLFFVDGASCAVADSFVCLTPNQTAAFLASDIDPGTTGYVIAVATERSGCPLNFNFLLGDAFVKLSSGHAANLPAESVAALPGGFVPCDPLASTALLNFDDRMYNALPRTLALSNIASRADGNNTLLIVNRIGGSLATSASTLANLFGVLYDDAETPYSFSFSSGTCQHRSILISTFPRTAPRFEQVIPAGRSGWLKLALFTEGAISGAALNANPNAGTQANAFNQGHNLHKLTLTTATTLTVPVFPPGC